MLCQVNARKVHDEPNVLDGVLDNGLFLGILGGEFLLQVRRCCEPMLRAWLVVNASSPAGACARMRLTLLNICMLPMLDSVLESCR